MSTVSTSDDDICIVNGQLAALSCGSRSSYTGVSMTIAESLIKEQSKWKIIIRASFHVKIK